MIFIFLVALFCFTGLAECDFGSGVEPCKLDHIWLNFSAGTEPKLPANFTLFGCENTTDCRPALEKDIVTFQTVENRKFDLFTGFYGFRFQNTSNRVDCRYLQHSKQTILILLDPGHNEALIFQCSLLPSVSPSPSPSSSPSPGGGSTRNADGDSSNSSMTIIIILVVFIAFCLLGIAFIYIQHSYKNAKSNYTKDNVKRWTTERVCQWLEEIELEQYKQNFQGKAIDGNVLLTLDEHDLQSDLSIVDNLHRRKIINFLQEMRDTEGFLDLTHPPIIASAEAITPVGDDKTNDNEESPVDIIDVESFGTGEGCRKQSKISSASTASLLSPDPGNSDSEDDRACGLYAKEGSAINTTHTDPLTPSSKRIPDEIDLGFGDEGSRPSGAARVDGEGYSRKVKTVQSILPKREVPGENPGLPALPESSEILQVDAGVPDGPGATTFAVSEVFVSRSVPPGTKPGTSAFRNGLASDSSIFEIESGSLPESISSRGKVQKF